MDVQAAVVEKSAAMDREKMGLINLSAEYVVAPTTMKLLGTGKYKLNYKITTEWADYIYNLKEYCTKRVMWLSDHLAPGVDIVTYHGGTVSTSVEVTDEPETVPDNDNGDVIVSTGEQEGSDSSQLVIEETTTETGNKSSLIKTVFSRIRSLFAKE